MTNLPPVIKIIPMPGPQGAAGTGSANTGAITFNQVDVIGSGILSGDGYGNGTINLVPDFDLKNNDQYLTIDPTAPNHIHIRAGGIQDASNAQLILGGEKANVTITDYNHQVSIQSYNETTDSNYYWSFGNDGVLSGPGMGNIIAYGISATENQNLSLFSGTGQDIKIYTEGVVDMPVGYRYPAILDGLSNTDVIYAELSHIGKTLWNSYPEYAMPYIIPSDSTVNLPLGAEIKFACGGMSAFYFTSEDNSLVTVIGEGQNYFNILTLEEYFILPPNRIATLTKIDQNRWIISGFGITD